MYSSQPVSVTKEINFNSVDYKPLSCKYCGAHNVLWKTVNGKSIMYTRFPDGTEWPHRCVR